jgi:hypothetical protein
MFGLFKKKEKSSTTESGSDLSAIQLIKKRAETVSSLCLKKGISETTKSRVAVVLDYSYSMSALYSTGFVQKLLERMMPLGIRFDDNSAIDVFLFHDKAYELGEVTLENFTGYVNRDVTKKYSMGGTCYSPVVNMINKKYTEEKGDVAYVIFITDGDCSDKENSEKAIKNASENGIFWQFVGIGRANFGFLEKLDDMPGRKIDNANFFQVKDLDKMSDENLYEKMMDEYPQYLIEAKQKGII